MNDILLSREQAQIPMICVKRRQRKRGRRVGCLLRICRRSNKPPLPSIAKVKSLENKIDDLRTRLNYQLDIQNCNILRFMESWLNDDTVNIQVAGYTLYRQDRTAASGKTRGGGLCIFVNNNWCTISKEVSSYCGLHLIMRYSIYLELISVFFVAVYIPPQSEAGTKNSIE